ncbi:MAG: hypothetical protein GEU99_13020 [Luteitalea sp.]|nr:hypothetical protein [Luteitalea sp.]
MSQGLAWQLSYTLARDIGDLERGQSPENAFDRERERGRWIDIPTHRVTGFLMYELPFGRGKTWGANADRWLNIAMSDWQVSLIYYGQTGQFLTPLWTGPDPTGTAFTSSATPALVTIRPNQLHDPTRPGDQRSVERWFDVDAFAAPTPGSFGTAARGTIKGPSVNVLHAGLVKHFSLTKGMRLRWELIFTNVLNHPNWSDPGTDITEEANVGVIQGVGGVAGLDQSGARSGRMSLRLEW